MQKKNKTSKRFGRRILVGVFLLSVILVSGYYAYQGAVALWHRAFTPSSFIISFKDIYSESLQKQIRTFIYRELAAKDLLQFSAVRFHKTLKNNFKIVYRVDWNKTSPGGAVLTVVGVKPLAVINNDFVVGNKRRLFPKSFFQLVDLASLKSIEVKECFCQERLSEEVYEFLQKIPNYILSRYNVSYEGRHKILLRDSLSKRKRVIIADRKSLHGEVKLREIDRIEGDYLEVRKERGFLRTPKLITYDVRFKNRIYVTTRQREVV
jgi:hypothetical protein